MIAYTSLVVLLVGLVFFLLKSPEPKANAYAEVGRIAYMVGLFIFLWKFADHVLHLPN